MKRIFLFILFMLFSIMFISCQKKKTYKIYYTLNGGRADDLVFNFEKDDFPTLPTPVKDGFTFIGWYSNEQLVTTISGNHDYTLEAKYEETIYMISFDLGSGKLYNNAHDEITSLGFTYSHFPKLNNPVAEGKEFLYYYEIVKHDGIEEEVKVTEIKENRNYSLIAKYRDLKKYTIHLEGFDDIEFYEDNFDITLPTPVKEGHKFIGWYENDKLITEINENRDYDLKAAYDDWLPWV